MAKERIPCRAYPGYIVWFDDRAGKWRFTARDGSYDSKGFLTQRSAIVASHRDAAHVERIEIGAANVLEQIQDNDFEHFPEARALGVTLADCAAACAEIWDGDWSDWYTEAKQQAVERALEIARARVAASEGPVNADDLFDFATTSGEFYARHLDLARAGLRLKRPRVYDGAWIDHVGAVVVPAYAREILKGQAIAVVPAPVIVAAAMGLREYYERHVSEINQTEGESNV